MQGGVETIVLNYEGIGGLGIGARVTVRCPQNEALTYWSLEVDNPTTQWIGHVQFPIVEVPYDRDLTAPNCSSILSSLYERSFIEPGCADHGDRLVEKTCPRYAGDVAQQQLSPPVHCSVAGLLQCRGWSLCGV